MVPAASNGFPAVNGQVGVNAGPQPKPHQRKQRAQRTHFTNEQKRVLGNHYAVNKYPSAEEQLTFGQQLGLTQRIVVFLEIFTY